MRLPHDGQEYLRISMANFPTGTTTEASVDRVTWATIPVVNGVGMFLCRGPLSSQTAGTLIPSTTDIWVRIDGNPEQVVRKVGTVTLY